MNIRQIYRRIAKENGVSVSEVKRDMQEVIQYAYEHTPNDGITSAYQNQVLRKGDVPTTDEFIHHLSSNLKNRLSKK